MNKKAVYGILIAILLPITGYFILKISSERTVLVPRHYIYDDVKVTNKNGKEQTDTIWHKVPDFRLTNQFGQAVSWKDMEGKLVVIDFFFTHCPTICPTLTYGMKELQQGIKTNAKAGNREADFIQFLSISIDPERDSVTALKRWADRFQINPQNWWLLTGKKKEIYNLSINDLKLGVVDGANVDTNFYHTDMFVLVDKNRNIRGYYHMLKNNHLDTLALSQLSKDIIFLSMEKDRNGKFFLADQLPLIMVVFAVVIIGVVLLLNYLNKSQKRV